MFFEATVNNLENHQALKDILINNKLLVLNRGAEVGVRYGSLTHALLQAIPNLSLIAVDPYAPYQDVHDFFTQEMQNKIKANAAMKLAEYYSRVTWIYEMSSLAANKVGARSLDFVFIDAEHTFSAVTTDCRVWADKIRPGGILCGHDYNMAAVKEAVDKFADGMPVYHVPPAADVWVIQL